MLIITNLPVTESATVNSAHTFAQGHGTLLFLLFFNKSHDNMCGFVSHITSHAVASRHVKAQVENKYVLH